MKSQRLEALMVRASPFSVRSVPISARVVCFAAVAAKSVNSL